MIPFLTKAVCDLIVRSGGPENPYARTFDDLALSQNKSATTRHGSTATTTSAGAKPGVVARTVILPAPALARTTGRKKSRTLTCGAVHKLFFRGISFHGARFLS
jgi:hypothetical protein